MKMYQFARLIAKYSVDCQLITNQPGKYNDDGIWLEPADVTEGRKAAIMPVPEKTVYNSGGRYTSADRMVISQETFPVQAFIIYKGHKYRIEEVSDYTEYADFYQYLAKWVSAFD